MTAQQSTRTRVSEDIVSKTGFEQERTVSGVEGGHPGVFDCLRANFARVRFHVGVVDLGHELRLNESHGEASYFRRLEGVVVREVDGHFEDAAFVRSFGLKQFY